MQSAVYCDTPTTDKTVVDVRFISSELLIFFFVCLAYSNKSIFADIVPYTSCFDGLNKPKGTLKANIPQIFHCNITFGHRCMFTQE